MGVAKYGSGTSTFWMIDDWVTGPDGQMVRFRKRRIPTKEMAVALLAKVRAETFEGKYFERVRPSALTVAQAWDLYEPVGKRDNDAWRTDAGRAKHLLRHLGYKRVATLSEADVDSYRAARLGETTKRKEKPKPAKQEAFL